MGSGSIWKGEGCTDSLSNPFAALEQDEDAAGINAEPEKQSNILDASSLRPPSFLSSYGLQPIRYNNNIGSYGLPLQSKSAPPSPKKKDKETQVSIPSEESKEEEVLTRKDGDHPIYEYNKIWIFWTNSFDVNVLTDQIQFVNFKVSSSICKDEVIVTAIYASCRVSERRKLWDGLLNMSNTLKPWIVMGDFNVVTGPSEQIGCKVLDQHALEEFNDFYSIAGWRMQGIKDLHSHGQMVEHLRGLIGYCLIKHMVICIRRLR
ncbi:hypothetical protein LIER_31893 [Lithospermum erythrorhizon]|uniref:Exo_endo_phos domain-containing protein n=1 Tax=Lithospermum erythrorhizon TaxID=34254 RepID=A0AAV3RVG4_LITER